MIWQMEPSYNPGLVSNATNSRVVCLTVLP
jgi:hypothetical protein